MSTFKRSSGVSAHLKRTPKGQINKYFGMYVAYIKDNTDVQNNGRLRVWVPEFGSKPDDETSWITVCYCSPFAGVSSTRQLGKDIKDFDQTQTSYGMWLVPPDLENQVAVMFANGDLANGYWIGCLYEQYMNQMVPAIAAKKENYDYSGVDVPVAEYNKWTREHVNHDTITRPVHEQAFNTIADQGLINDHIRGITTSSARREAPSQVYGISTPGPKNPNSDGNRLGGSKFIMDDGEGTEYIGLRTRSGAYIRIDETNGLIYAINKKGTSWFQMDEEGNFDVFAAKSVSIRSQEDINLRADRDVNIEAGRDLRLKASQDYVGKQDVAAPFGGSGGNILVEANNKLDVTVFKATKMNFKSTLDVKVLDNTTMQVDKDLHITTNNTTHTSLMNTNLYCTGDMKITSLSNFDLFVNKDIKQFAGLTHNVTGVNSCNNQSLSYNILGGTNIRLTAPVISENGSPATPAQMPVMSPVSALPVLAELIPQNNKKNVLPTFSSKFKRDTRSVRTIVSRFMTYEPCNEHINKGQGGAQKPYFSKYTSWFSKPMEEIVKEPAGDTPEPVPEPIYIEGDGDCSQWTFPPEAKPYEAQFRAASEQYGVPLCVLVETARQESQFNPKAHNKGSNAQGMMQIVPRWHPTIKNPYDPNEAIPYGAKYLAENRKRFGSWDKALVAYNWGPGALNSHLKKNDGKLNDATLPAESSHYYATILGKAKYVEGAEQDKQTIEQVAGTSNNNTGT